ncbi:MAG: DUF1385 domain-containing protein [Anaerolineales bacterium]|nr:DUF1385 domain-containing protein [Anaerolineales bacterium]
MSDLKLPTYGGQALIEGVLMRGSHVAAIAMRSPDQTIVVQTEKLGAIYRGKMARIPFLRGLVLLWDALGLGMRALTTSANIQSGEEEQLEGASLYLTIGLSLVIGVGFFFLAPAWAGQLLERYLHWNAWWSNLAEGLIRLGLMIGYIWGVGKMPDIARVFAYHGAEHKTINAFEAGMELTPENVTHASIEHPRCGTSFLLTLVVFSVLMFSVLGPLPMAWRLISRVLLLPVLTGVAYEYIRWTSARMHLQWVRWIVKPNLALQHLTTREPSLDMLEVAIASFNHMYAEEKGLVL